MAMGLSPPQGMVATTISASSFPLTAPDGSTSAPSYAFSSSTATGILRTSTGTGHLVFEGAAILAYRLNTSATILRVFNTWTDANNGEWFEVNWQLSTNILSLRTAANGTGSARVVKFLFGNLSNEAIRINTTVNGGVAFTSGENNTSTTGGARVTVGGAGVTSGASGTAFDMTFNTSWTTASASTMVGACLNLIPTINYSNGTRTGANRLIYCNPTNTSLQTGNNAAIALSSTAAALGGILIFNTSDEVTNTEKLTITATANKFKIMSVIQGTGTQRDIVLGGSYGGGMVVKVASTTLTSVSGASVTATSLVPARAQVIGVATYVTVALGTGSGTTGYTVGDGSDADRFGAVTGTSIGTDTDSSTDATADPRMTWSTSAANIVITAAGGNFDGTGTIRVEVYYIGDTAPTS